MGPLVLDVLCRFLHPRTLSLRRCVFPSESLPALQNFFLGRRDSATDAFRLGTQEEYRYQKGLVGHLLCPDVGNEGCAVEEEVERAEEEEEADRRYAMSYDNSFYHSVMDTEEDAESNAATASRHLQLKRPLKMVALHSCSLPDTSHLWKQSLSRERRRVPTPFLGRADFQSRLLGDSVIAMALSSAEHASLTKVPHLRSEELTAALSLPSTQHTLRELHLIRCDALTELVIPEGFTSLRHVSVCSCQLLRRVCISSQLHSLKVHWKRRLKSSAGGMWNLEIQLHPRWTIPFLRHLNFRDYGSTHLTPLLEDEVEAAAAEFQVAGTRSISGLRSDSCSLEGTGSKLGRLTELTLKGMPGIPLLTGIMQLFDCSVDLAALVGVRWSCWGPTFADSTGPWHCMRQMCISQDAGLKDSQQLDLGRLAPFLQHLVLKKCATLCDLWMEDVTHLATLHVSQCESLRDIHLPYPVAPLQRLRILSCQKLQSLTCAIQGDLDTVRSLESVTLMQCPALQPPYALWQHAATSLRHLQLSHCSGMDALFETGISTTALPELRNVSIIETPLALIPLQASSWLHSLTLRCKGPQTPDLGLPEGLVRLTLSLCRPFVDVVSSGKVSLPWLSTLVMEGCMDLPSSEDLQTVLEKLPHLEHLGILNCTCISQLTLVEPEDRDSLTILDISGCIELTSVQVSSHCLMELRGLEGLPKIQHVCLDTPCLTSLCILHNWHLDVRGRNYVPNALPLELEVSPQDRQTGIGEGDAIARSWCLEKLSLHGSTALVVNRIPAWMEACGAGILYCNLSTTNIV